MSRDSISAHDTVAPLFGCGCLLIVNLWLGTISVQYLVETYLHKAISWGWAALIGLAGGELTVPAAVVTWLLKHAGVI